MFATAVSSLERAGIVMLLLLFLFLLLLLLLLLVLVVLCWCYDILLVSSFIWLANRCYSIEWGGGGGALVFDIKHRLLSLC